MRVVFPFILYFSLVGCGQPQIATSGLSTPPPDDYPSGRPRGELPLLKNLGNIRATPERTWVRVSGWVLIDESSDKSLGGKSEGAPSIYVRLEDNIKALCCFEGNEREALAHWVKNHPTGTAVTIEGLYAFSAADSIQLWNARISPNGFQ